MRRGAAATGALLVALTAGCGGARPLPPAPPALAPPPDVSVDLSDLSDRPEPTLIEPPREVPADAILDSPWARHPDVDGRALYWQEIFTVRDARGFPVYLERMGAYEHLVDSVLGAEGLPRSLRYLPIIESGYSTGAVSPASAAGLWQFMAPVARGFGMQVTPLVDERRDPVKSSLAAARYLKELHERFDSWFLALAAYNGGPYRVERLLRQHAPLAPLGDSLFLVLAPHLPRETREFVPKLLAAARVAEHPERFGIERPAETRVPYLFDEVEVPDATSLDVVADAADVDESVVRALNPHVLRGVTPRGQPLVLRLPPGTADGFAEAYASIPADRRVTVTEHVVRRGETISGIAAGYGIRASALEAANPGVRPRRLQIGHRLLVPLLPGSGRVRDAETPSDGVHVVRQGESLWAIARRYDTTVRALQERNGLSDRAILRPGDRLRVGAGG
jgi:membrane-bound lytic murein transglycosylase D